MSDVLPAANSEIHIYGDASFQFLIATGSWAFCIPALDLEGADIGDGPSTEHFEIMAGLSGVERVLEIDRTQRPIRVLSDSDLALQFLQHAAKREPLPQRKAFHNVRPLYKGAVELAGRRRLIPTKVTSTRPEHQECHRRAAKKMRETLANDSALAWRLAFRKEEYRLEMLMRERAVLQSRMEALEEEAVLVRVRISALERIRPLASMPAC